VLALPAFLVGTTAHDGAVVAAFAGVTVWVVAVRVAAGKGRLRAGRSVSEESRWVGALRFGLGVAAGVALFPGWVSVTWKLGLLVGLDPARLGAPLVPHAGSPALWLAGVVLAPCFEELLYREQLRGALGRRLRGPWPALVSSAFYAASHLEPWAVLGTFVFGVGQCALLEASESIGLCIGVHVGLNLAAVLWGVPPAAVWAWRGSGLVAAGVLLLLAGWGLRPRRSLRSAGIAELS